MRDYYYDGFEIGYGKRESNLDGDYPKTDGDRYSYECGKEDGARRARIGKELEDE